MLANALLTSSSTTFVGVAAKPGNLNRHKQPQQEQSSGAHTDIQFPNFDATTRARIRPASATPGRQTQLSSQHSLLK
jgi:hypothetical protein